jgi:hypothetical protein
LLHMIHQPAPGWEWVSSPLQGDKQFKFEEWNLISTTLRNCSWNMKSQNSYDMQGDRAFVCNSFSPRVSRCHCLSHEPKSVQVRCVTSGNQPFQLTSVEPFLLQGTAILLSHSFTKLKA